MWPNPQETGGLVTITEEILNGKLHFVWSFKMIGSMVPVTGMSTDVVCCWNKLEGDWYWE